MGLFLGNSENLQAYLSDQQWCVIFPTVDDVKLISFDGYKLKDIDGLYLTTKEAE